MGKHILLIGLSAGELAAASTQTSPAIANINALKQTLLAEIDDLRNDQVSTLINPNLRQLRHAIALMTYRCRHNDLCLIYYTGCGLIDPHTGKFYLPASDTRLDGIVTTTICSDYIRQALPSIQTGLNKVMILDCMWGSLPPQSSPTATLDPNHRLSMGQLADCGCNLFTALGSNANPWPMADTGLSLYTQCLIEGITTGLADIDADGGVSVSDLQTYMANTLDDADLDIFPISLCASDTAQKGSKTPLISVTPYSPEREYRRSVEAYVCRGHISSQNRNTLDFLRYQLGITLEQSHAIESAVVAPYRDHQDHCDRYRQALTAALELESPLGKSLKKWLRHLQRELSLSYEDVSAIETDVTQNSSAQAIQPLRIAPIEPPQLPARVVNQNGKTGHRTN